jgi:hypothetical protein
MFALRFLRVTVVAGLSIMFKLTILAISLFEETYFQFFVTDCMAASEFKKIFSYLSFHLHTNWLQKGLP